GARGSRRVQLARDELQERRLAGAVRTEDRDLLTLRDVEAEAVEHPRLAAIHGRVADFDQGCAGFPVRARHSSGVSRAGFQSRWASYAARGSASPSASWSSRRSASHWNHSKA